MALTNFSISHKKIDKEYLHIDIGKRKKRIQFALSTFRYRDKDTRQLVLYIPSLDISSYGATKEKVQEMLEFSLNDYCKYLCSLPSKKIDAELTSLGWKHHRLRNKEYSKVYVDGDGELRNFNAVADKVERLTLQT